MTDRTSWEMGRVLKALLDPAVSFGKNCNTKSADPLSILIELAAKSSPLPLIAESNTGIPKYADCHIHDVSMPLMADYAVIALICGATIIGGYWRTTHQQL